MIFALPLVIFLICIGGLIWIFPNGIFHGNLLVQFQTICLVGSTHCFQTKNFYMLDWVLAEVVAYIKIEESVGDYLLMF